MIFKYVFVVFLFCLSLLMSLGVAIFSSINIYLVGVVGFEVYLAQSLILLVVVWLPFILYMSKNYGVL